MNMVFVMINARTKSISSYERVLYFYFYFLYFFLLQAMILVILM